jgi:hypothetical protein
MAAAALAARALAQRALPARCLASCDPTGRHLQACRPVMHVWEQLAAAPLHHAYCQIWMNTHLARLHHASHPNLGHLSLQGPHV